MDASVIFPALVGVSCIVSASSTSLGGCSTSSSKAFSVRYCLPVFRGVGAVEAVPCVIAAIPAAVYTAAEIAAPRSFVLSMWVSTPTGCWEAKVFAFCCCILLSISGSAAVSFALVDIDTSSPAAFFSRRAVVSFNSASPASASFAACLPSVAAASGCTLVRCSVVCWTGEAAATSSAATASCAVTDTASAHSIGRWTSATC
mmetsp:Transcript_55066/g.80848  ORF Transcript_55066/g.80848 Transcript_55066/m.80848 type:complete len:202 (+) Transcript_55066:382-987(+)